MKAHPNTSHRPLASPITLGSLNEIVLFADRPLCRIPGETVETEAEAEPYWYFRVIDMSGWLGGCCRALLLGLGWGGGPLQTGRKKKRSGVGPAGIQQ